MKKFLIAASILFSSTTLFAETRVLVSTGQVLPGPANFVSEAVYYTSFTCAGSNLSTLVISTRAAHLFSIDVSSRGFGSPIIEVFDARQSTGGLDGTYQLPAGVRQLSRINGLTERDHLFNVGLSSGLAVSNQGLIPPCISIHYSEYGK